MRQPLPRMMLQLRDGWLRLDACAAACVLVSGLAAAALAQQASTRPGHYAPGVVTTIAPGLEPEETVSTHDLVEIRANPDVRWQPEFSSASRTLYGMAAGAKFRRDVWCLEFSFKPLRMIAVDVPLPNRKLQRRLIWYLVYSVRNTGETLKPAEEEGGVVAAVPGEGGAVRFVPSFVLESQDRSAAGDRLQKSYLDRVIPTAQAAIEARESRGQKLLNSAEMAEQVLRVSDGGAEQRLWGIAMWEDVDPRIDFFSVYVGGLTNAYRWVDPPRAYRAGDPPGAGRQFARKMLQLNFWRPGDEYFPSEQELRYGVPRGMADLYGVGDGVAYRWVYR